MDIYAIERGFTEEEHAQRLKNAQKMMFEKKIDAILLTTEHNVFYFSGFLTQFWKSASRPWFLVLPSEGKPIAVIPSIGKSGMEDTWVDEIHTWDSPFPKDDGITLLKSVLEKCCKKNHRMGVPLGHNSTIRMPNHDFMTIQKDLSHIEFVDVSLDIHKIRSIKSPAEIEKISAACIIANRAFDMLPYHAKTGQSERDISKQMAMNLLYNGADSVEYLICGSGQGGYNSIIMGPTNRIIKDGDIAVLDTGATFDGYYTDFCRNFAFGYISEEAKKANEVVHRSIDAAFDIARPGVTTMDIYYAMWNIMESGGALSSNVGRLGHGLGTELTEWPSHMPHDPVTLEAGMVITLEPGMYYAEGKSLVHEENIVITEEGAKWLTRRAQLEMLVLE